MGAALHCGVWASHCGGFFHRGAQALGARASVVVAHRPSCSAESSQTRDGTCVPYTGTWILIYCTTREVPHCGFDFLSLMVSDVEYGQKDCQKTDKSITNHQGNGKSKSQ